MRNYEKEVVACEEVDGVCRYFDFSGKLLLEVDKSLIDGVITYHTSTSKHYIIAALEDLQIAQSRLEKAKEIFSE